MDYVRSVTGKGKIIAKATGEDKNYQDYWE